MEELHVENEDGTTDVYGSALFLVHSWDDKDEPRLLTHIPPYHEVDLEGGEEFITGFLHLRREPA